MLFRIFLYLTVAVVTTVVNLQTTEKMWDVGPSLHFDKVNVRCFPVQVACNAPSGCVLQDSRVVGKQAFCNATESYLEISQNSETQLQVVPFALFYVSAKAEGGLFPLSVPADAKRCGLNVANTGKTTTVSLACEFDKAVNYRLYEDGEIRKLVIDEDESKQDETTTAGSATTANPGGQQQQQEQQQQQQQQQQKQLKP